MSSAVQLRKTLLSVLQEIILPELQDGSTPRLITARLPLRTPDAIEVRAMPYPPLREADATRVYPEGLTWDAVHMHALDCPTLYCIVEGEADLLMGVTTAMLSRVGVRDRPENPRGGYILSLPATSFFLIPPGVPRRTGATPPWYRDSAHTGTLRIFNVRALPIGALCNITTLIDGVFKVRYSLLIEDDQLATIMGLLINEQSTPDPDPHITQAQLLTLMLRLQRGMSTQVPAMTDGLYSRFPDSEPTDSQAQPLHHPVIERAHKFIKLRLHESLSPADIAAHVRLTPTQLNRIFKANTGTTTMSYVTKLRMESAQLLLHASDLSVQEISRLVGYQQLAHFSRSFRSHTGFSPLKFRQGQGNPLIDS